LEALKANKNGDSLKAGEFLLTRGLRTLAAILAADVVGHSRLMDCDESGMLVRLKAHRAERLEPALARNLQIGAGQVVQRSSPTGRPARRLA
jgi:class 3 adenylate cyclase